MKVGDLVKLSDYYIKTFGVVFGIVTDVEGLFIRVAWVSDETIESFVHQNDLIIINSVIE